MGGIGPHQWASFTTTSNNNPFYAHEEETNLNSDVLYDEGQGQFKSLGYQAVFVAEGRGRLFFGNSYSEPLALPIHGGGTPNDLSDDLWQAQALHFHCGTVSNTVRARLRKIGNPSSGLKLTVLRHDFITHKVIHEFTVDVPFPKNTKGAWTWVDIPLSSGTGKSLSPDCKYFSFHSRAGYVDTDGLCNDCYQISGSSADKGLTGS